MLYPLLLAAGALMPAVRPVVVAVPAPQFTRPSLTAGYSRTTFPAPKPTRSRFITYSTTYTRASYTTTPATTAGNVSVLSDAEAQMLRLINADRAACGLPRLALDPTLVQAARSHCRDMRNREYFEHDSSLRGQRTPLDRYRFTLAELGQRTPPEIVIGENIFYISEDNGAADMGFAHRTLMNSPGHRANILDSRFTKAGIAVLRDADGELWVTEMFLRDTP